MKKFKNSLKSILCVCLFSFFIYTNIYANEIEINESETNESTEETQTENTNIENISETIEYVEVASNIEAQTDIVEQKTEENITQNILTNNALGIVLSEQDYQNLLQITEAEATGKDLMSKILVANVVINRLRTGKYGNITNVIFAPNQFSPIRDGRFWNTPTSSTIEAVNQALNGIDYSQGALFFMNRKACSKKNQKWFDTKCTFLFKHGNHEFFK